MKNKSFWNIIIALIIILCFCHLPNWYSNLVGLLVTVFTGVLAYTAKMKHDNRVFLKFCVIALLSRAVYYFSESQFIMLSIFSIYAVILSVFIIRNYRKYLIV